MTAPYLDIGRTSLIAGFAIGEIARGVALYYRDCWSPSACATIPSDSR